jgi:hypothetical protein
MTAESDQDPDLHWFGFLDPDPHEGGADPQTWTLGMYIQQVLEYF